MKLSLRILVILALTSCGQGEEKVGYRPIDIRPCVVRLNYKSTQILSGIGDWLTYRPGPPSDTCAEYIGENVQALSYSLRIQARPSPAILQLFALDQNRTFLISDGEIMGKGDLTLTNIRQEDWAGPLDRIEDIHVDFLLPEGAERALYPYSVELTIASR